MRLEWFRKHKQIVYTVLVPMVVISFVLYGASGFLRNRAGTSFFGGESGPGVTFTVGAKEVYLSPSQVLQKRLDAWRFNNNNGQPSTDEIAYNAAAFETARQQHFEIGVDEQKEILKQTVQEKIQRLDSDGDAKATAENYRKLLSQMEMSSSVFERIVHDESTAQKFYSSIRDSMVVTDPSLYVAYCIEKESVRLRYLAFKSENYLKDTKQPDDAAIKKFYDESVKEKEDIKHRDILFAPMTMSVEALGLKDEKAFVPAKPTDDDLKKHYDLWKSHFWKEAVEPPKDAPKPGDKPPEDKFKPFDSVKADVEIKWLQDENTKLKNQFTTKMGTLMNDLSNDEKKFKDEPANKDKSFDLGVWAKAHNVTLWVTPEQTEDTFKDGKLEMNAPDIKAATNLWTYARDYNRNPAQKMTPDQLAAFRRNMNNFTSFQYFDIAKPELGGVWVRSKKFNDEKLKLLDEAKPEIVNYLKSDEAIDLAKKAAEKAKDDWVKGQNLPKLDELDEVVSDAEKKSDHPMVQGFKRAPKVIGDVLDVQSGLPEDAKKDAKLKDHRLWFYVGCAVERKQPDWDKFAKDSEWNRESNRQSNEMLDQFSVRAMMVQRIKDNVHKLGDSPDQPLGDVLRNSRNSNN